MATAKDDKKPATEFASAVEIPPAPTPEAADAVPLQLVAEVGPARIFRDRVFTSRTLIMPDGRSLPVSKGRVIAFGDDQFDYLNAHPDLELIAE